MPYIYKEYPRTMHRWPDQVRTVRTDDEKAAALAEGWSLLPLLAPPAPPDPVDPPVPETETAPEPVPDAPRRGRPRKVRA